MPDHNWIADVLQDLEAYAVANELDFLADRLSEVKWALAKDVLNPIPKNVVRFPLELRDVRAKRGPKFTSP